MYVSLRPFMGAPLGLHLVNILHHFQIPKVYWQKNMNQTVGVYLEVAKLWVPLFSQVAKTQTYGKSNAMGLWFWNFGMVVYTFIASRISATQSTSLAQHRRNTSYNIWRWMLHNLLICEDITCKKNSTIFSWNDLTGENETAYSWSAIFKLPQITPDDCKHDNTIRALLFTVRLTFKNWKWATSPLRGQHLWPQGRRSTRTHNKREMNPYPPSLPISWAMGLVCVILNVCVAFVC